MPDCVFCKIAQAELPSTMVYEDELCLAFKDAAPQAPAHVLIIPREHIPSLADASPQQEALLGHLMIVAAKVARQLALEEDGYRVVTNIGTYGAQTVRHLHLHVLGGRQMGGDMG